MKREFITLRSPLTTYDQPSLTVLPLSKRMVLRPSGDITRPFSRLSNSFWTVAASSVSPWLRQKHKDELKALKAAEEAAALAAKQKSSAEGVIDLTLANFEREVLRSGVPVAVDCWADWCGPCKQFSPIFEGLAKQYVGVVKFAKLDTDASQ